MNEVKYFLEGNEFIPLCDLIKRLGFAETGGMAKQIISEGHVFVNGEVETRKRFKVRSGHEIVIEDNKIIVLD